jgi:hypothetical protein
MKRRMSLSSAGNSSCLQVLDRMIARKGHISPFFFAP